MSFKEIIGIILAAALANNAVFSRFFGVTPIFGWSKNMLKALPMGVCVAIVMLFTEVSCWCLNSFVLAKLGLGFLQIPVFVGVILAWTYILNAVAKAVFKKPLGIYFPVIALNSAVLGLALTTLELGLGAAMLTALGTGLGFILAMLVFVGVSLKLKINFAFVPKAFKGLPVELLAAGIVSLAFLAF